MDKTRFTPTSLVLNFQSTLIFGVGSATAISSPAVLMRCNDFVIFTLETCWAKTGVDD